MGEGSPLPIPCPPVCRPTGTVGGGSRWTDLQPRPLCQHRGRPCCPAEVLVFPICLGSHSSQAVAAPQPLPSSAQPWPWPHPCWWARVSRTDPSHGPQPPPAPLTAVLGRFTARRFLVSSQRDPAIPSVRSHCSWPSQSEGVAWPLLFCTPVPPPLLPALLWPGPQTLGVPPPHPHSTPALCPLSSLS